MKFNDAELISGLDQTMRFDPTQFLSEIDDFYLEAKKSGDAFAVLDKAGELIGNFRASGLALAKLLYMLNQDWNDFGIADRFEDVIFDVLGISRTTVGRYVAVWNIFANQLAPQDVEKHLQTLPMKSLIPIAKAVEQGYEINTADWENLSRLPDEAGVRNFLRELKGQPPRKSGITIILKQSGDLEAYSDSCRYVLGYLNISSGDEVVIKALQRIIDNSGIMKE